jgi:DNA polymerase
MNSHSTPPPAAGMQLFEGGAEHSLVPPTERPILLDIIRNEVAGCTRCSELAASRTQTVFGVGDPNARLMFVGEAPGADEDRRGEPFVGRAGQLLTRIIEACKLRRDDVYIANVLKCRPPDNRTPLPDEVLNCRGYLERQIDIIRPEMICCLGAIAAQTVLNSTVSIGRLRGTFHDYQGIPVVCTYHPSYLLRNPDAKRFVWDDMKMLMKRMGVEL